MERLLRLLLSVAVASSLPVIRGQPIIAVPCGESSVRGNIEGEDDRVRLSLGGHSKNCFRSIEVEVNIPQPFSTLEIACSSDRQAAAEGLCSTTPCPDIRRFFAFRTIHFPDGTVQPAGFQCVSLAEAAARPGVTVGEVFDAVRRVRLPGGEIGVEPGARGLANLESFFWVEGANQPPVDLQVGGSTVHAEFRVVEYRWAFGDDQGLVTTGPGSPGLDSEVSTTFRRRGF
jgi:hypothetical protein